MKQPPAFQFYVSNFIEGTSDMEQAEVGAYIRLMCYQWANGALPDDAARLERVAGGEVTEHVMVKFPSGSDGKRRNARLEVVRQQAKDFKEKCSEAGKRGGGNPNFKPGQPNPYYDPKDKGVDKGHDNGEHKGEHKGSDKGEINSPISDLRSPSLILELQSPPLVKGAGKRSNLPDADWIASLKSGSAYLGIDIDRELARMQAWAAEKKKVPSRGRFLNWLNRIEKPISANGHTAEKPLSLFELKTIVQAKELKANDLKHRFSSDVALGVAWSDDGKKAEWQALRREIKELNNRMASYAR